MVDKRKKRRKRGAKIVAKEEGEENSDVNKEPEYVEDKKKTPQLAIGLTKMKDEKDDSFDVVTAETYDQFLVNLQPTKLYDPKEFVTENRIDSSNFDYKSVIEDYAENRLNESGIPQVDRNKYFWIDYLEKI